MKPHIGPTQLLDHLPSGHDSGERFSIQPSSPDTSTMDKVEAEPLLLHMPVDVRSVSIGIIVVLAMIFFLDWAQVVIIPIMLGVMISYAFDPVVTRLKIWRIPRTISAAIILLAVVGGPAALAYSQSDEAASLVAALPEAAQKLRQVIDDRRGSSEGPIDKVQRAAAVLEKATTESAPPATVGKRGVTLVQMEKPSLDIREYVLMGTRSVLAFAGQATVVLFLAYFLMVSGDTFRRKLVKISGPTLAKKKVTVQVLDEITGQIQRFLLIQVVTGVIVGVASWLAFLWLGLEHAAIWGILAGVCNSIPYLGPVIVAGGTALVAFLQFGTLAMTLLVSGLSLAITSLEGYLLTPWLTGRAGRMSPVVVFVAVLFWGWLWGAWGLLLGVPIIMMIKAVCDRVEDLKPIGELLGS